MRREDLKTFEENITKVKLLLKNRFTYTGYILEVLPDSIRFKDKFGNKMTIDYNSLVMVTELEK